MKGEKRRRIIITTIWCISSLFAAILTPNIGILIQLLGSLASANVFIFPSLCLLAIARREKDRFSKRTRIFFILFSIILIITGFIMFLLVLYQVYDDLKTESIPHEVLCKWWSKIIIFLSHSSQSIPIPNFFILIFLFVKFSSIFWFTKVTILISNNKQIYCSDQTFSFN